MCQDKTTARKAIPIAIHTLNVKIWYLQSYFYIRYCYEKSCDLLELPIAGRVQQLQADRNMEPVLGSEKM